MNDIWEIIGYFKHNHNDYVMVINDKCRKFFFRVTESGYEYLTIIEYVDLIKKYNTLKIIKSESGKNIKKLPLIKIRNKLVSAFVVLGMIANITGCSPIQNTEDAIDDLKNKGIIVECINDENDIYELNSITFEKMKNYKYSGISFEAYSETPFINYSTPDDMNKYLNEENIT